MASEQKEQRIKELNDKIADIDNRIAEMEKRLSLLDGGISGDNPLAIQQKIGLQHDLLGEKGILSQELASLVGDMEEKFE